MEPQALFKPKHAKESAMDAHLTSMTVSMRVMSAGDGYKYLLRSIAAADGDRSLSTPLTRYYAEVEVRPRRRGSVIVVVPARRVRSRR